MEHLWLDVSLWSADLANLEREIKRLEPYADSFHFDAADGHFVSTLLFFPDLIARLRELTRVPFHVHLMATRPQDLIGAFIDAGADRITLPVESGKRVRQAIDIVRARGKHAGVSLELDTHVMEIKDHLPRIDTVVMMGTALGVKGLDPDARAYGRIRAAKDLAGPRTRIVADGGIREYSVPLLRQAGADGIVPGSLICKAPDLPATARWLRSL
jgi:ribulose-phosphate 3-epimerase